MARTYNPTAFIKELSSNMRTWVQSVHLQFNGNVDMGSGTATAPSSAGINAGVFTQFKQGNSSGVLIRVAGHGVVGSGASYNWPAAGSLVLNHGLLRQPIGYKIVDKDKTVDVFRTVAPDKNQITLQPTDNTASVTLYVF